MHATSFERSWRKFCTDPISIIKNSAIACHVLISPPSKELGQFVPPSMRLFLSTLPHSAQHSTNNPSSSHDNHGQYIFITQKVAGCYYRDKPPLNACHVSLWTEAWSIKICSPCAVWTSTSLSGTNWMVLLTSGRTGSSMPTTQMHVRSFKMSASLSQSGSVEKSLMATQMVLNPSQAIGSITFCTISSRSLALKTRCWPEASRIWEHLMDKKTF